MLIHCKFELKVLSLGLWMHVILLFILLFIWGSLPSTSILTVDKLLVYSYFKISAMSRDFESLWS